MCESRYIFPRCSPCLSFTALAYIDDILVYVALNTGRTHRHFCMPVRRGRTTKVMLEGNWSIINSYLAHVWPVAGLSKQGLAIYEHTNTLALQWIPFSELLYRNIVLSIDRRPTDQAARVVRFCAQAMSINNSCINKKVTALLQFINRVIRKPVSCYMRTAHAQTRLCMLRQDCVFANTIFESCIF